MQFHDLMTEALNEAKVAREAGDVPVGAVIEKDGKIIARAHNEIEISGDATAHAEILAIRKASAVIGDWRLNGCTLCVTLEPCSMCSGAIKLSRVSRVVFGTRDPRFGVAGSVIDLLRDERLGAVPEIIEGINANECSEELKDFFREIRRT